VQFIFAFIGASAAQRGPLWWAAHHRHHHRVSDSEKDPHSPKHKGFLNSHCLWFLTDANFATRHERVKDLMKYPELVWLDRFDWIAPVTLAFAVYGFGAYLESNYPALNTSAGQVFIWGFVVSTIVLYHATYTINSLAHAFGSRRFATKDDSRNNWLLALLTLGEGWHNNHHYYCGTVRQGFKWWEIDITFYLLKIMSWMGLVKNLKPIPAKVKQAMALQKGN
jgi:stearoyl-CoA desaturase (delta-9 desaturase)